MQEKEKSTSLIRNLSILAAGKGFEPSAPTALRGAIIILCEASNPTIYLHKRKKAEEQVLCFFLWQRVAGGPALPVADEAGPTGSAAAAFAQTTVKRKSYSRQSGRMNPQQKRSFRLSPEASLAAGEGFELEILHPQELF